MKSTEYELQGRQYRGKVSEKNSWFVPPVQLLNCQEAAVEETIDRTCYAYNILHFSATTVVRDVLLLVQLTKHSSQKLQNVARLSWPWQRFFFLHFLLISTSVSYQVFFGFRKLQTDNVWLVICTISSWITACVDFIWDNIWLLIGRSHNLHK